MNVLETLSDDAFAINQYGKEKEYWIKKLSGTPVKSVFPYDHTNRGDRGDRDNEGPTPPLTAHIVLPHELSAGVITLGTGKDQRIHIILLAVMALLLEKYTGSSDIILGVPIYKQEKEGRFINTALAWRQSLSPVDVSLPPMTFKQLLLQSRETLLEAVKHQNYPLNILAYQLDLDAGGGEFPLFDIIVLMDNIHDKKSIQHLNCNIVFTFSRNGENITGEVEYNPLRYEKATIDKIIVHFTRLLAAAVANVEHRISELDILTPEEKDQLLNRFNDTAVPYPREKTLSRLFLEQVNKNPDRIAILDLCLNSGGPIYITYRELNRGVVKLALLLQEKGAGPGTITALLVKRPMQWITGILAIVTAGSGYMPIDPEFPSGRMQTMLKDSNAAVLLKSTDVDIALGQGMRTTVLEIVAPGNRGEAGIMESIPDLKPGSLAYVLYTSGSTGGPKGVMVDNRNVVRLAINSNYMEFSENTRLLQNGSPVFDALTFELWGTLLNGGQLVLAEKEFILDAGQLGAALKKYRINAMLLTPVFFNQLVQQDSKMFSGLEWLLVGGDLLSPAHINQVRAANPQLKVVNAYGPTENTVISTSYLIDKNFETGIPIGRPINNTTATILDNHNRLQPIGLVGELCVGGDGLARGYMNNADLTADKFINKSFCGAFFKKRPAGGFLYKTGDLARWMPDGNIEFLGRRDYQVKIRGHRIELGEIESRLLKHSEIIDATVVFNSDGEQPFLCAYFVANRETPASGLRDYLKEGLPDYMVPTYLIPLEKLPCTPTGKIDRKALPDPRTMAVETKKHQLPMNEDEAVILRVWSEVLEISPDKISTDDDFFDLGGNSINILKVQNELKKHYQNPVSMSILFLYPTIKELAAGIIKQSTKNLECVVKLNKSNSKKNIFIFHPLHGMTYQYKELAKLLEDRYTVYGVQAKGLTVDGPLPGSIEEMLNEYLKEIRQVQATGPYIFSGYCVGNILAYEAARAMEDQGEQVEAVVLLDLGTVLPEKYGRVFKWKYNLEMILFIKHIDRKEEIRQNTGEATEEQKRLMARVKSNNSAIFAKYHYKRIIESPLIHIRARENLSMFLFHKNWLKMSKNKVKLFTCTGNHHNIFIHPHIDRLVEIIKGNV
ncbi:MAG TPA: amino acid adenylation domain-containing protein [Candidatus Deferrimicrobium sp.]|nr:amino acid adenylation domain-containing protein [Candidatus Deferrimicrobium sp.]